MDQKTSIFLDICRFSAAFIVLVSHAAGQSFTGGILWQVGGYIHTAVMVFFILSGFVIAYVTETRETTAASYAIARVSRLYSVMIPAILLTFFADAIGLAVNADFYHNGPWSFGESLLPLRTLMTLTFTSSIWASGMHVGSNGVVWSLCYEAWYYVLFGLFTFTRGRKRWLLIAIGALISGPAIWALFPLWLAGIWIYRLSRNGWRLPAHLAIFSFLTGTSALAVTPMVREMLGELPITWMRPMIVGDYYDGAAFCLVLIGFISLPERLKSLVLPMERSARWLGKHTFELYMFHIPIIFIIAATALFPTGSWQRFLLTYSLVFIIVFTLTPLCQRLRILIRSRLLARFVPSSPAPKKVVAT